MKSNSSNFEYVLDDFNNWKSKNIIIELEKEKKTIDEPIELEKIDITNLKWEDIQYEKFKLKDISEKIQSGATPSTQIKHYWTNKYDKDKINWLDIDRKEFLKKSINKVSKYITEQGLKNSSTWIVPKNSIMITIGGSLGYVAINKIKTTTNQNILNIILKTAYYSKYVLYVLDIFYINNIRNKNNYYGNLSKKTEQNRIIKIPKSIETKEITLTSYQLQQIISKYLEDKFRNLEHKSKMLNTLEILSNIKKDKILEEVFKDKNDNDEKNNVILYEVKEDNDGNLEYVLDDENNKIELGKLSDVEFEEKELMSFFYKETKSGIGAKSNKEGNYNFYCCSNNIKTHNIKKSNNESIIISTGGNLYFHLIDKKIAKKGYSFSSDVFVLISKKDITINLFYIYCYLNNISNYIDSISFKSSKYVAIGHLTNEHLNKIKIKIQ